MKVIVPTNVSGGVTLMPHLPLGSWTTCQDAPGVVRFTYGIVNGSPSGSEAVARTSMVTGTSRWVLAMTLAAIGGVFGSTCS